MQINLKTKNLELTEPLQEYAERKVGELEKFTGNAGNEPQDSSQHEAIVVDVELSRTTNHHQKGDVYRAELNLQFPGAKNILRAESEQWDVRVAIDDVKDEMQRQLRKYRGKKNTKKQKGRRKIKDLLRLSKLVQKDDE